MVKNTSEKFSHKHYTESKDNICQVYPSTKNLKGLPKDTVVVKLRGSSAFSYSPESEGKTRYMIARLETNGDLVNLGILKQYEAVVQLKQLLEVSPRFFSKKKFAPNKNGTFSQAFLEIIGTNKISQEVEGVPTLQQAKAFMVSGYKGKVTDYMN